MIVELYRKEWNDERYAFQSITFAISWEKLNKPVDHHGISLR